MYEYTIGFVFHSNAFLARNIPKRDLGVQIQGLRLNFSSAMLVTIEITLHMQNSTLKHAKFRLFYTRGLQPVIHRACS